MLFPLEASSDHATLAGFLHSFPVCKHWALAGKNAFSHGGGIHQDGILKDARTYEIMTPESVGLSAADRRLHVGKLSGRAALSAQLHELGYDLEAEALNQAFNMAKLLLGKKKALEELDLRNIADTALMTSKEQVTASTSADNLR